MSKRLISVVRGSVHDIEQVSSLSSTEGNIRLLSDRSLYILQNLSGEDVTFLSRYGEILDGGYYLPVEEGSPEAEEVYNAINLVRRDLTNMTVESTLECICAALQDIAASVSAAQGTSCGCDVGSDVDTTSGQQGGALPDPVNGVAYDFPSAIVNRKCKASNYIHGAVKAYVSEFKANRLDQYGYAAVASVLQIVSTIVGGLVAGPAGLLIGAVVGSFLSTSLLLWKASFSLTLLLDAIEFDEDGAICALYEASSASVARDAYTAHLLANGATSAEIEFVEYLLPNNLLNLLFFAWGDSEAAIDGATIIHDCSTCTSPLAEWYFQESAEGWTHADMSLGASFTTMNWEASTQALRNRIVNVAFGQAAWSHCNSPAFTVESNGGQECVINVGAPVGGLLTSIVLDVYFQTQPAEQHLLGDVTGAAELTAAIATIDTITGLTVRLGRNATPGTDYTIDLLDVIIRDV